MGKSSLCKRDQKLLTAKAAKSTPRPQRKSSGALLRDLCVAFASFAVKIFCVSVTARAALFLLLLLCLAKPAPAWGPEGHQFVADVARSRLTATTKRHIRELLGNDDLAAISTWADEV